MTSQAAVTPVDSGMAALLWYKRKFTEVVRYESVTALRYLNLRQVSCGGREAGENLLSSRNLTCARGLGVPAADSDREENQAGCAMSKCNCPRIWLCMLDVLPVPGGIEVLIYPLPVRRVSAGSATERSVHSQSAHLHQVSARFGG